MVNKNSTEKTLYITFDDGPTPVVTEQILAILKQYNAKATFFCIGKNVEKNPSIFDRIIKEEHAVGNHTYNHLKGWKTSNQTYIDDVKKTQDLINSEFKTQNSKLFRPPYGKIKSSQAKHLRKLGYKIIMWDVLSYDWESHLPPEKVLNNTVNNAKSGSIIVFHDSIKASKNVLYTLPKMLNYFNEKGFVFKKLEVV